MGTHPAKINLITHLSSVHPAKDVRIYYKECRSLAARFGPVVLIAQTGGRELCSGVEILPLKHFGQRWNRMTLGMLNAAFQAFSARSKIVHFHDPELIPAGLVLRALGRKVIYDVHEDLPRQVMCKPWLAPPLRRLVGALTEVLERIAAKCLSGIVAATPTIASRFPSQKTEVIRNFPRLEEFNGADQPYAERDPIFVYAGGISAIRGAREMVLATNAVSQDLRAKLILAGSFMPHSFQRELEVTPGWHSVNYVGWRLPAEVVKILGSARAGLILLHPTINYLASLPIKLFEYMAAGLPVIASDFPQWKEIIEREGCGLMVDPLNPKAIAAAMEYLLTHPQQAAEMGERGRRAVLEKYNWESESRKLIAFYERLLAA